METSVFRQPLNLSAKGNRVTVRTYELNLLLTGGWLSASCEASEPVSLAYLLEEKHRSTALASRYSYVGSIMYASGHEKRSRTLSPIGILPQNCTIHNGKCRPKKRFSAGYALCTGASSRCFRMRSRSSEHSELRTASCASV